MDESEVVEETGTVGLSTAQPPKATVAIRLHRIETARLLVERWNSPENRPDWFDGREGVTEIAIAPEADHQISIRLGFQSGAEEGSAAVACTVIAYYEIASEGELVQDPSEFLSSVSLKRATNIANRGIRDLSPVLREAVLSATARIFPERPLVLDVPLGEVDGDTLVKRPDGDQLPT